MDVVEQADGDSRLRARCSFILSSRTRLVQSRRELQPSLTMLSFVDLGQDSIAPS